MFSSSSPEKNVSSKVYDELKLLDCIDQGYIYKIGNSSYLRNNSTES